MKSAKIFHKFVLIFLVQLVLFSFSTQVEAGGAQQQPSQAFSFLGPELQELSLDHTQLYAGYPSRDSRLLAMATGTSPGQGQARVRHEQGDSLDAWHKYLGYGTVLLAGVTAATSSQESLHESAAYVTAAGALTTVLTGFLAHGDRFDTGQGMLTRENLHIALGTLGAALLTTAVAIADEGEEGSHSGLGVTGGVMMALGVIDIKW